MGKNFQPHITLVNSEFFSKLPKSIISIADFRSNQELSKIDKNSIFYILEDSEDRKKRKPLRDASGRYFTFILSIRE